MVDLRKKYWLALIFGALATLASGLVGGRELDGMPASIRTWGLPLPWLKRVGPTQYAPSIPVKWSIGAFAICFPFDTLFWSIPGILVVRWRYRQRLRRMGARYAAGQCAWCGYDLKGLAGRCPECRNFTVSYKRVRLPDDGS